jgi:hypothetical protein
MQAKTRPVLRADTMKKGVKETQYYWWLTVTESIRSGAKIKPVGLRRGDQHVRAVVFVINGSAESATFSGIPSTEPRNNYIESLPHSLPILNYDVSSGDSDR